MDVQQGMLNHHLLNHKSTLPLKFQFSSVSGGNGCKAVRLCTRVIIASHHCAAYAARCTNKAIRYALALMNNCIRTTFTQLSTITINPQTVTHSCYTFCGAELELNSRVRMKVTCLMKISRSRLCPKGLYFRLKRSKR